MELGELHTAHMNAISDIDQYKTEQRISVI
jgi:hypothetical protein